ncbi:MAG: hypothetical protein ACREBW_10770 [Candidatus Micrarchaeaceae archaeon]
MSASSYNRQILQEHIARNDLRASFSVLAPIGLRIRERYNERNVAHGYKAWGPIAYMAGGYGDAGDLALKVATFEQIQTAADHPRLKEAQKNISDELGDHIWVATVIGAHYGVEPTYHVPADESAPASHRSILVLHAIGAGGLLTKSVMAAEGYRDQRTDQSMRQELASRLGGYVLSLDVLARAYDINAVEAFLTMMDGLHARLDAGKE